FAGIFYYQSKTKLVGVIDGTSNTIMFGEYSSAYVDFGASSPLTGETAGAWACGQIYTYWPPDTSGGSGPLFEPDGKTRRRVWYKCGSRHAGLFNVGFADGSVRPLQNNIDFTLWVVLGGKADGWVPSSSDY